MNGLLSRTSRGWVWRDGTHEKRVRDLRAAEAFQFPTVSHPHPERPGAREVWVRVPDEAIEAEPDLAEFVASLGFAARPSAVEAGFTEVPEAAWRRFGDTVIGIVWEPEHEQALFDTAEAVRRKGVA
ncbi:MAG: hypothetical protein JNK72_22975 [Myxococcales bacterium]|nr:hypothetical protein [Myxococcales bacterium]